MGGAIRVLQAGDLKLDDVLCPVARLSEADSLLMSQARERAARALFDQALEHNADLVILTGCLAEWHREPRLEWFLIDQLQRLHAQQIAIVWISDSSQPPTMDSEFSRLISVPAHGSMASIALPRAHGNAIIDRTAGAETIVRIGSELTIRLGLQRARYAWQHSPTVEHPLTTIQSPGPNAEAQAGAWLTEFEAGHPVRLTHLATEVVTWRDHELRLADVSTRDRIQQEIISRSLMVESAAERVLHRWTLTGASSLWEELLQRDALCKLQQDIASRLSEQRHIVWKIDAQPDTAQWTEWRRERLLQVALTVCDGMTSGELAAAWADAPFPCDSLLDAEAGHRVMTRTKQRLIAEFQAGMR